MKVDADRDLLFGLLAIQNDLIDRDQVVAALREWALDKNLSLAEHLVRRGDVDSDDRAVIEALVARHLRDHGSDAEKTVAAMITGEANLESPARSGGVTIGMTTAHVGAASTEGDHKDLDASKDAQGAARGQRFRVLRPYAQGGLGAVFVALDTDLHREVAFKQILEKHVDDPVSRQRFLLEAEITGGLEHPGIVPVYGLGVDAEGRPYYAMRFIRGDTLRDVVERFHLDGSLETDAGRRSLELRLLLRRFVDVCNAVDYAHGRGVLHRDIKPANVIVGKHGETLLVDWGLAKALGHSELSHGERTLMPSAASGSSETLYGNAMGTPAFMSPEQAAGALDRLGPHSDVYSLGATLYNILTGRPPLLGHAGEIIRKSQAGEFRPPRQIDPSIERPLEAVCLKAMALKPESRYATARALADDVERWQADEPVSAWREPPWLKARRWARKHRVAVSVAAGLLMATTIALAISTVLITRERNEAEAQGQQAREAIQLLTGVAELAFDERLDPIQREFLEKALAYYQKYTDRVSTDPAVRLEHGRAHQQMGDIERKLGHFSKSEEAYRQALEILEPLASAATSGRSARQSLARTQALLGDLMVRRGDRGQAEVRYRRALHTQHALVNDPAAAIEDRLRLGQTLKSQAELLRLKGDLKPAKSVYDQAIAVLEAALATDQKHTETRNVLALAIDYRGSIHRELGDLEKAEKDYRRARELLESLVGEFPTVPRHREGLARAYNSLGMIEAGTGRLADAEIHFRSELPLVERLAQDFPDQPDYQRELARTLMNLEQVLSVQNRSTEAEPFIRRAIDVNTLVAAKTPEDVQIRFDLSRQHNNLGEFLRQKGEDRQAIDSFLKARTINESLLKASPDEPRYRENLAGILTNLALAQETLGDPKIEDIYKDALRIYEKLVADHPDNVNYKVGQARCLKNFGPVVARAKRPQEAEAILRKSLGILEAKDGQAPSAESLRDQAEVLNNLGDLQLQTEQPSEAEESLDRAIAIFERLVQRKPTAAKDQHNLGIAQNNLGELLVKLDRLDEAEELFEKSLANFETLVAQAPKSIEFQSHFSLVLANEGGLLDRSRKPGEARAFLKKAVEHQRQAIVLSKNRDDIRMLLGSQLMGLARIDLKLGAYSEAAALALEVPGAVPVSDRSQGCLEAARILAGLVSQSRADAKITQEKRTELENEYLPRTIILLREAIDLDPKLNDRITKDRDFDELRTRPEFSTMLNSLVEVKRPQ